MLRKILYLVIVMMAILVSLHLFDENDEVSVHVSQHPYARTTEKLTKEMINTKVAFTEPFMVNELIDKMSIEEKIGQLIFAGVTGKTITAVTEVIINQYKVGGIILFANNLENVEQSIQLLNQLKTENEQNPLPLFLGVDQEGGRVERLPGFIKMPTNEEIGMINNEKFSYKVGELLGKQLNSFGFNLNFAPVIDIDSNPNNPVIADRSFGKDPKIVGKLGMQTMLGMKKQHIIPVVKHFPGHGDTEVDSHLELPLIDKSVAELQVLELIPFKESIEAGVDAMMTAHILLPQIDDEFPASMSKKVITGILREQLDYDGVVMTDDMTMRAITDHFEIGEAAVQSIKAGTDIILIAHHFEGLVSVFDTLRTAIEDEEITEERINQSIQRIMQLKQKYGINDERVETIDAEIELLNKEIEKVLDE